MKILIIRLSSFGDIVQCLPVLDVLKREHAQAQLDWLVRSDFAKLVESHPALHTLWSFDRKAGLRGWWKLSRLLSRQGYTHVYDAHNNLRSTLMLAFLRLQAPRFSLIRRSKDRLKRWLMFRLRIFLLPQPFVGQRSFLQPLAKWGVEPRLPEPPTFYPQAELPPLPERFVALVPSAAWEMKRWPVEYWSELIARTPVQFVLLGGPDDHFCAELAEVAPERVLNLAGQCSLAQSCAIVAKAQAVVANDTGLLHVADALGRPLLALIGPTAFGYPAQKTSEVLETDLYCKPCSKDGRGKCINPVYKKCLLELKPGTVSEWVQRRGGLF